MAREIVPSRGSQPFRMGMSNVVETLDKALS